MKIISKEKIMFRQLMIKMKSLFWRTPLHVSPAMIKAKDEAGILKVEKRENLGSDRKIKLNKS